MVAQNIVDTALEHGYVDCGIIGIDDVADYADQLRERIEKTPESAGPYAGFYAFANLHEAYPWAKSIVVCARQIGKYRIPEHLEGLIGKSFLTDARRDEMSPNYQASVAFEAYLKSQGLRVETERKYGITALRWAAHKAGLGIIRRNNFFYADCGSWVSLEAWLIDRELVLKQENTQKPCPPNCNRCIAACPTKSLREPYTMSMVTCISCLTTHAGDVLINEPNNQLMGSWIYGCDVCQNVCPFNDNKWEHNEEYPGLSELSELIGLEKIIEMDYATLFGTIQPKFWYIDKDQIWKWKTNALNAIRNNYDKKYDAAIEIACHDANEKVRETAHWVKESIQHSIQ